MAHVQNFNFNLFQKKLLAFFAVLLFGALQAQNLIQKNEFINPPQSSQVNTWWHWIYGNISKEGISKDLESMKRQGIKQATILSIGAGMGEKIDMPQVKFNLSEWYGMFQFALKEANRLGLSIGVHNCDGWSASGGPWIKPETSIKTTTWTKTYFKGGRLINQVLEKTEAKLNYYEDYAVVAFPYNTPKNSFQKANPAIFLNKENTKKYCIMVIQTQDWIPMRVMKLFFLLTHHLRQVK